MKNDGAISDFAETRVQKKTSSYIPSYFVICNLPIRSTKKEVKEYRRKYNRFQLKLVGANDIPGGKIARDMLSFFTTACVQHKNVNSSGQVSIHFSSMKRFMQSFGLENSTRFLVVEELLDKFAGCNIFFEMNTKKEFNKGELPIKKINDEVEIPQQGFLQLKSVVNVPFFYKYTSAKILGGAYKNGQSIGVNITLSAPFAEMAQKHPVPIDFNGYRSINSALGKDIYSWLVYRNNGPIPEWGVKISRESLIEQFSPEEQRDIESQNYQRIIEEINDIKFHYYPELNIRFIERGAQKGIILYKSDLVIKKTTYGMYH
ncbi:MAG: hypothetical protein LBB68_04450 [Treponema sp.]|jgi:hypothetical protein|nr:hypothetical protein [Treponema sp.]